MEQFIKTFKILSVEVVMLATVAMARVGNCQVQEYQLTMPLTGQQEVSITDWGNNPGIHPNIGSMDWTFSSLSETIYLDPINLTVRQVGVVYLQPATTSPQTFTDTHDVSGQMVSSSLTISQSSQNGGLSFDTGAQPVLWNATTHQYTYNQPLAGNSQITSLSPILGSYSLNTGGQTYTGTLNYTLQSAYDAPNSFTAFSPGKNGSSLTVSGLGDQNGTGSSAFTDGAATLAQVTAANGFSMQLSAGQDDQLDYFSWGSGTGTATATPLVVPEPSSFALIGVGLAGLFCLRLRKTS
jgi:hypothetical protein